MILINRYFFLHYKLKQKKFISKISYLKCEVLANHSYSYRVQEKTLSLMSRSEVFSILQEKMTSEWRAR